MLPTRPTQEDEPWIRNLTQPLEVDIEEILTRGIETTSPRRTSAAWPVPGGNQIIEVDEDNNQQVLSPDEVVELRHGKAYAKKHRFQRG